MSQTMQVPLHALTSASNRASLQRAAPSSALTLVSQLVASCGLQITSHAQAAWRSLHSSVCAGAAGVGAPAEPQVPAAHATARPPPAAADETDLDLLQAIPGPSTQQTALARTSGGAGPASLPPHVLRDLKPPAQPYQLVPKQAQRPIATPALYTPWTPTRALQRRRHITKRMGFLMHVLEREQMERAQAARPLPAFRAGDILEVRVMVPEAERKVALYRGVCIARYDKGIRSSFKIYNVFPDCGGVVQHLPLYMPDLLGVRVVGRIPAKQERLYYLLERQGSEYTFQTNVTAAS